MSGFQDRGRLTRERVLGVIAAYHYEHGYAPTVREVASGAGVNVSTAHYHLGQLRAAGKVTWVDGCVRTLRLVRAAA